MNEQELKKQTAPAERCLLSYLTSDMVTGELYNQINKEKEKKEKNLNLHHRTYCFSLCKPRKRFQAEVTTFIHYLLHFRQEVNKFVPKMTLTWSTRDGIVQKEECTCRKLEEDVGRWQHVVKARAAPCFNVPVQPQPHQTMCSVLHCAT